MLDARDINTTASTYLSSMAIIIITMFSLLSLIKFIYCSSSIKNIQFLCLVCVICKIQNILPYTSQQLFIYISCYNMISNVFYFSKYIHIHNRHIAIFSKIYRMWQTANTESKKTGICKTDADPFRQSSGTTGISFFKILL